ncbi:MAG: bifunctional 4-hydroxy-2-oxoglutarate aldolase/2-dehydro-3-deoxy-phosphogluconate aldolase [Lewinellaceae bacterium]|nr:bifunctional 4-hydroxy-2-oxoglutarate aldolase/2-dehydro-3-deoxy-phosphogluconate aldolase [Saprospiraceae bacterium]MCB9344986.1 bifunctional 4-hydroxy-2-oxoglutarate aldolase/2-dehydro-3-deoxy-phosphogluconate aldolase [Lewinellaceae bacterium]
MLDKLIANPIVPVFYHADAEYSCQVVKACYDGGLRFFEFTNRGESAFGVFKELVPFVREHCPDMEIGIGTIFTASDAEKFLAAGADFVVQPVTTSDVAKVCQEHKKPWMPGALTLNEIWTAWDMGAALVKVFPGNIVGPDYIKALRGPMPKVPLMVTGGVHPTRESIGEWLDAGVQAVGMGSQLFKGDAATDSTVLSLRVRRLSDYILERQSAKS